MKTKLNKNDLEIKLIDRLDQIIVDYVKSVFIIDQQVFNLYEEITI